MKLAPKLNRKPVSISLSRTMFDRIVVITKRDMTTPGRAVQQMIEFALPYFEDEKAKGPDHA